jgi:hypothetical protein
MVAQFELQTTREELEKAQQVRGALSAHGMHVIQLACNVGFEGCNGPRPSRVLGHWLLGGVLLGLHQGQFAAVCEMSLAGNTCNDDDARNASILERCLPCAPSHQDDPTTSLGGLLCTARVWCRVSAVCCYSIVQYGSVQYGVYLAPQARATTLSGSLL